MERSRGEKTLVIVLRVAENNGRASTKWRRNGRAPSLDILLQKPLRPEPRDRVRYRNCLPLEQPAGHRKANRRVAQVHYFHRHPQSGLIVSPSGEEPL